MTIANIACISRVLGGDHIQEDMIELPNPRHTYEKEFETKLVKGLTKINRHLTGFF